VKFYTATKSFDSDTRGGTFELSPEELPAPGHRWDLVASTLRNNTGYPEWRSHLVCVWAEVPDAPAKRPAKRDRRCVACKVARVTGCLSPDCMGED
jgi:hypothetical protein